MAQQTGYGLGVAPFGGSFIVPVYTAQEPGNPITGLPISRREASLTQSDPDKTPNPAWIVTPRVRMALGGTDNVNLSPSPDKQSDLILEAAPGVRVVGQTARLNMVFDYTLAGYAYARNTDYSNFQSYLNTYGTLEAVDNWLFLDFSGYVNQQIISPFGVQSVGNTNQNNNRTQIQTYRLSPYIRGQLGGDVVEYFLRYNASTTHSSNSSVSDVDISQWLGQVRGGTPFYNLTWAVDASSQRTDYTQGRDYNDDRVRGVLNYRLLPQLIVTGTGGQETNNYATLDDDTYATYGYGLDWRPTDRTIVAGYQEKRFFGWGHNVNLSHRFPLTALQYTDVKDVAFTGTTGVAGAGGLYDQYFALLANQIPDPTQRAAYVNNLLSQAGLNGNGQASQVAYGYLNNRPIVRRTQQFAATLYGARNSLTFRALRYTDETIWLAGGAQDPLNPYSKVTQTGYSLSYLHRLTPTSNLNLLGYYQTNDSAADAALNNTLKGVQLGVGTALGPKTIATLSVRRTLFSSDQNPYNENAFTAALNFSF